MTKGVRAVPGYSPNRHVTQRGATPSPQEGTSVECDCWEVFDRNERRTGTIRQRPREDCPMCHGTGYMEMKSEVR